MFKITINSKGNQYWLNKDDQSSLDLYIQECIDSECWGRNAYDQVISLVKDENGNILQEEQIIHHESEWSYEIEDITIKSSIEQKVKEGLAAQSLGAEIIAKVWAINESKELNAQQFNAILQDQTLQNIERLLWNGSLKTAKLLIQSLDNTYFSNDEKQSILDMLINY